MPTHPLPTLGSLTLLSAHRSVCVALTARRTRFCSRVRASAGARRSLGTASATCRCPIPCPGRILRISATCTLRHFLASCSSWLSELLAYRKLPDCLQATGSIATIANVTCHPMRSSIAQTGRFNSSSSLLNQIHTLNTNTAEANLMSVWWYRMPCVLESADLFPSDNRVYLLRTALSAGRDSKCLSLRCQVQSDCPHRERLGYGGDALMSGESLLQNFDMSLFYEKRILDYVDAQRDNGNACLACLLACTHV